MTAGEAFRPEPTLTQYQGLLSGGRDRGHGFQLYLRVPSPLKVHLNRLLRREQAAPVLSPGDQHLLTLLTLLPSRNLGTSTAESHHAGAAHSNKGELLSQTQKAWLLLKGQFCDRGMALAGDLVSP